MVKFIFKKLFYSLLVLFGVITTIFFLFNVLPGDPANIILGQRANKDAIAAIHKDLGTDKHLLIQYLNYLNDLSPISFHNKGKVDNLFYLNPQKYNSHPLL